MDTFVSIEATEGITTFESLYPPGDDGEPPARRESEREANRPVILPSTPSPPPQPMPQPFPEIWTTPSTKTVPSAAQPPIWELTGPSWTVSSRSESRRL